MRWYGKITHWNEERGFGFVEPDNGGVRAFVHIRAFRDGSRRPVEHDAISYQLTEDNHGRPLAEHIEFLSSAQIASRTPGPCPTFYQSWLSPLALLITLPLLGIWIWQHGHSMVWPGLIYLVMSTLALILYGLDKRAAQRHCWRIPERTLLLFGFFGGALGESAAMLLIRHKTKHLKFMLLLPLFILLQAAAVGLAVYFLT